MSNFVSYNTYTGDETRVDQPYNATVDPDKSINAIAREAGGVPSVGFDDLSADLGGFTARRPHGAPVGRTSDLQPTDIITVGGMETTVQVARMIGLLGNNDAVGAVTINDAPPDTARPEVYEERMDDATEEALDGLVGTTQPGSQIAALMDLAKTGVISERAIGMLATEAGVEPSQMRVQVDRVMDGFQRQVDETVKGYVSDPELFYAWAKSNRASQMQAAIMQVGTERSTAKFRSLAQEFFNTADSHNPDLVKHLPWIEGTTFGLSERGGLLIRTPDGKSHSWHGMAHAKAYMRYMRSQ